MRNHTFRANRNNFLVVVLSLIFANINQVASAVESSPTLYFHSLGSVEVPSVTDESVLQSSCQIKLNNREIKDWQHTIKKFTTKSKPVYLDGHPIIALSFDNEFYFVDRCFVLRQPGGFVKELETIKQQQQFLRILNRTVSRGCPDAAAKNPDLRKISFPWLCQN